VRILALVVLLFIALPCLSQEVQELSVFDFSGGWANGLPNATMQNSHALVLSNYDLTADSDNQYYGLKRRAGMQQHYVDAQSGTPVNAIFPHYGAYDKDLLLRRSGITYYTDSFMVDVMSFCEDALTVCTTQIYQMFYRREHDLAMPFNTDYTTWAQRLLMASTKSELMLWDGDSAFPARPMAPGQPKAVAIDGGRELNGIYNYKYRAVDNSGNDTSWFSPPSWDVHVNYGRVALIIPPRAVSSQEYWQVYRKAEHETDYYECDSIATSTSEVYFVDSLADGDRGSVANFTFGETNDCLYAAVRCELLYGPAGMTLDTSMGTTTTTIFENAGHDSIQAPVFALYTIAFLDSSGRESYIATPSGIEIYSTGAGDSLDVDLAITIAFIDVPTENNIVSKILRRKLYGVYLDGPEPDSIFKSWYTVDTLDVATTTYTDSLPYGTVVEFCSEAEDQFQWSASGEFTCYDDLTIDFTPSSLVEHGNRFYAIGDARNPNRIYYSEFGLPTTWDPVKYLDIPTSRGDWFVKLLSISNYELLAFRQHSIVMIQGLSYYQYTIEEIMDGLGLTAPMSLVRHKRQVYFAHQTGLYKLGQAEPLSATIQPTIDSVGAKLQRSFGSIVENEYWWSVPVVAEENDRTLIYSDIPTPHWKSYSFGGRGVVQFDSDTTEPDFRSDKYIILHDNDSLWRWNYDDTTSRDGVDSITAIYQSKYFFEGGGREKIHYVDLFGTGTSDSLWLIFYKNYGESKPGVAFDSVAFIPDFSAERRNRVVVRHICENFSLRIEDRRGVGDYTIKGYVIGWQPWDGGKL
jgi:hypothetical protein